MAQGEIYQMLAREELLIRRGFRAFLRKVRSPQVLAQITRLLRQRNVAAALAVISDYLQEFAQRQLPQTFVRVARAEVQRAQRHLGHRVHKQLRKQTDLQFDAADPAAVDLIRRNSLEFVNDFTAAQKRTVQRALAASLQSGEGPREAARSFRDAIGLTENQWSAVQSYRNLLEQGSSEALNRSLRDKRFDANLRGAIERGDVLDAGQIDRMVDRYSERMLDMRAETIARTESHRAMSQARHAAWAQVLDQIGAEAGDLTRTWVATQDARTRDTHAEMDGQQVQGLDEPFESPSGALLMHPGDPSAPPEETINCRCTETYELAQ